LIFHKFGIKMRTSTSTHRCVNKSDTSVYTSPCEKEGTLPLLVVLCSSKLRGGILVYEGLRVRENTSLCYLVFIKIKWVTIVTYMSYLCAHSPAQMIWTLNRVMTWARTETSSKEVVYTVPWGHTKQLIADVPVVSRAVWIILGGLLLLPESLHPYPAWISFRRC
jgi:hypothetical protein